MGVGPPKATRNRGPATPRTTKSSRTVQEDKQGSRNAAAACGNPHGSRERLKVTSSSDKMKGGG